MIYCCVFGKRKCDCCRFSIKEAESQQPFISLVDQILKFKKEGKDTQALEDEIDTLVYRLYDLTDKEIAIVEGKEK